MGNLYSGTNTATISDNFLPRNEFNNYTSTAPKVLDLNTVLSDPILTKKLLDSLSSDSRFKGQQGLTGPIGPTGSQGIIDTSKNYTFTDTITFKKPMTIYKNGGSSITFKENVTGYDYSVTNANGVKETKNSPESLLQIDPDINNSGDYVIYSSIPGVKGTNLNLQPQNWAGNVRIGYNPNNYGGDGKKDPPNSKLAVNGDVYSSGRFISGGDINSNGIITANMDIISSGKFTSKNGYQIENIYKIQFPESRDSNQIQGSLKYIDNYSDTNTDNLYYRTNTTNSDIAKFKILINGSTIGDNLKFTNDPNKTNECLAVSDGSRRALTKKTCNTYDPSQHFVRNGIKIYNPYSDLCMNIDSKTGLWNCLDENNQKTSFRPV